VTITFGSLFAGIGGFDLGFERAGMECRWQVEIDDYANRILAKHWPHVRRWSDVRTWPQPDTERVDVICGGFPCQDISYAGMGAGLDGERSGLFYEAARIIRELEPRVVVLENVAALLTRGMDAVLGTLASDGYDAEWLCLPACLFGLPHIRERAFVIAHANSDREPQPHGEPDEPQFIPRRWGDSLGLDLAQRRAAQAKSHFRGMDDGVPNRMDRTRGLGNAVSPIVAEWIGRRIVRASP
jgi:DNA (cytosine-5)-methyltransferase 1